MTHDDLILTGKIAVAHSKEFPDYYERLERRKKTPRGTGLVRLPESESPPAAELEEGAPCLAIGRLGVRLSSRLRLIRPTALS